ncbi:unnamed protein product [Albugo candida]|uniref:Secreted protein n=1 Tax=Albugo candida TaxID=65357 RepID=A0A024GVK6_9STRA|nr:unnamed protein product [Albugo candida]|eukprot:CCI50413.1 unnamed protein product [Albugo candida]
MTSLTLLNVSFFGLGSGSIVERSETPCRNVGKHHTQPTSIRQKKMKQTSSRVALCDLRSRASWRLISLMKWTSTSLVIRVSLRLYHLL